MKATRREQARHKARFSPRGNPKFLHLINREYQRRNAAKSERARS